jgi:hypothetical protein
MFQFSLLGVMGLKTDVFFFFFSGAHDSGNSRETMSIWGQLVVRFIKFGVQANSPPGS